MEEGGVQAVWTNDKLQLFIICREFPSLVVKLIWFWFTVGVNMGKILSNL